MNIGKENEYIEFNKSTSLIKEGLQSVSAILNKNGKYQRTLFYIEKKEK